MRKKGIKCPVCGGYKFEEENNFEICPYCMWENDGVQHDDPDYAGGANDISLNEARKDYKVTGTIYAEKSIKCPVCGKYEFDEEDDFDVCPVCMWENDGLQNKNPDYAGGANQMSLNEARKAYKEGREVR